MGKNLHTSFVNGRAGRLTLHMEDYSGCGGTEPTPFEQLQHDEKVYAIIRQRGYECSAVLIRTRFCALYRGTRLSDGGEVLLKTYESKLRMQRARDFLKRLAGTGTGPSTLG